MNECMNELEKLIITPNTRLVNPISKRFTYNRSYTSDELSTWIKQSQVLMLRSTDSFLIVTYSGPFLLFDHLFKLHFSSPTFIPRHLLSACLVSVL